MKITQIMLAKGFGGAERYFVDLSVALAEQGHDVQAICHRRFCERARLMKIPALQIDTFSPLGWWDLIAGKRIENSIGRFGPAVVHAHLARGACMAGRACARLGIPLVAKTHNYVDLKYYRHVDCFIATTHSQEQYLVRQGIAPERIRIIPNFSSQPPAEKVKTSRKEPMQFVTYGRLVRKKGFHILLESFRRYLDQGYRAYLVIGGDGPESETLREQCRALQLEPFVTFSGWVTDIEDFMKHADVFVLPSLDEPFGIAVLEAMALGVPIIATTTDGPREILDTQTAFLVSPGDVELLASAMVDARDDLLRREKASSALRLFRNKYSKAVVVTSLMQLYGSMRDNHEIR
ncbi:MAG TPA: glycosyltransferase [Gammaproteobacteria bacterium]|nr:glycosyltransferase [Gammaproteobacteria bacterium]